MIKLLRLMAALLAAPLSGCGVHGYLSPNVNAHVVDAGTGLPVAGAQAEMWSGSDRGDQAHAVADANGWVTIPALRGVLYPPLGIYGDPAPPPASLRISAPGYQPRTFSDYDDYDFFVGKKPVMLSH